MFLDGKDEFNDYVTSSLTTNWRLDGRSNGQIRNVKVLKNNNLKAFGSCYADNGEGCINVSIRADLLVAVSAEVSKVHVNVKFLDQCEEEIQNNADILAFKLKKFIYRDIETYLRTSFPSIAWLLIVDYTIMRSSISLEQLCSIATIVAFHRLKLPSISMKSGALTVKQELIESTTNVTDTSGCLPFGNSDLKVCVEPDSLIDINFVPPLILTFAIVSRNAVADPNYYELLCSNNIVHVVIDKNCKILAIENESIDTQIDNLEQFICSTSIKIANNIFKNTLTDTVFDNLHNSVVVIVTQ